MTVFQYDFDGPDTAAGAGVPSPVGLPPLVAYSGSWRRLSNRAHTDTAHTSRPMLGLDPGGAGGFDLAVNVSAFGGDALYARWVDPSNWLCARVRRYQVTNPSGYTEYTWRGTYGGQTTTGGVLHNAGSGSNDHSDISLTYTSTSNSSYPGPASVSSSNHTHTGNGTYPSTHTIPLYLASVISSRYVDTSSTSTLHEVVLERSVSGVITTLGTASTNSGLTKMRLRGIGSALTLFLNDSATAALSRTDSSHLTATKHGIGRGPSELTGTALDNLFLDNLNSPPNAPSINIPAAFDRSRPLIVSVPLNDPDIGDTAKESFVQTRTPAVSQLWAVHKRVGSNTDVTVPADSVAAGQAEFQAASRDAQGLPVGDENLVWSESKFTQAGTPPAGLGFVDPVQGAQIPGSSYLFVLANLGAPITAYEYRVLGDTENQPDPSKVLVPATLQSNPAVLSFLATGLQNSSRVHAQVRGFDGALAGDWVTTTHQVVYVRPAEPGFVRTTSARPALINIRTVNPAPTGGEPEVVENRIWVRVAGRPSSEKLLAIVAPGGIWTWRRFASGIDYEFDVEAIAASGTASRSGYSALGLTVTPVDPGTPGTPGDEGAYADASYDPAFYA